MGQLFGTKLVSAGHDVVMVDAFEPTVQALNERGMILRIKDASTNVAVRAALAVDVLCSPWWQQTKHRQPSAVGAQ